MRCDRNVVRTCAVCCKQYERTKTGRNNVCSDACRKKRRKIVNSHSANEIAMITECAVCKTPFRVYDYVTVACSTKCLKFIRQREASTRTCLNCGRLFSVVNVTKTIRWKSCSIKCRNARNKKRAKQKRKPHVRIERTCVICSKTFTCVGSQTNTCSLVCRYARRNQYKRKK